MWHPKKICVKMKSSAGIQGQGNHFKWKKSKCSRGIKDSALTSAGHANKDIFRTVWDILFTSLSYPMTFTITWVSGVSSVITQWHQGFELWNIRSPCLSYVFFFPSQHFIYVDLKTCSCKKYRCLFNYLAAFLRLGQVYLATFWVWVKMCYIFMKTLT